ncbi:MAG: Xaa-Pro peptidase family protein [bacterium]|jgi:Xaa-Pro aminopeptidase|nr:Xaa-Pro peptidase family protein [bacterium]
MNYKRRLHALLHAMEKEGVDWLLIHHLPNVLYLSGFTGSHGVLLISQEAQYLLTDGRYTEQVQQEVHLYKPIIQGNRKEAEAIRETLGDCSAKTLWFEADHCLYSVYEALQSALAPKQMIGQRDLIESLRMMKDEEELARIQKALRVAEEALLRTLPQIKEGMTERELAHIVEHEMWKGGGIKESFESIVLFGSRTSLCHGKPMDVRLKNNQAILMDFGCIVDAYCSDITRMIYFGKPTDEFMAMYRCVYQANQAAEDQLREGVQCKQGDAFARDVIAAAGRKEQFMHGLGHGVGLEIHESPRLSYLSEQILEEGMVVTVEPGVYIENTGGVRLEDMVVIEKDGCRVLNQQAKDLIVL